MIERREPHFSDSSQDEALDDMVAFAYVDRKLAQYGVDSSSLDQDDLAHHVHACEGQKPALKRLARVIAHQVREEEKQLKRRRRMMILGLVAVVFLIALTLTVGSNLKQQAPVAEEQVKSSLWDDFRALLGMDIQPEAEALPEQPLETDLVETDAPATPEVIERDLPDLMEGDTVSIQSESQGKARVVLSDEDLERLEAERRANESARPSE